MKRTAVLIPEFGNRNLTMKCVRSIPRLENLEIYIGDDGYYCSKNESSGNVHIVSWDNNVGFARNVNRIVDHVCGESPLSDTVLVVVNSDIIFEDGAVELLVQQVASVGGIIGPALILPEGYFGAFSHNGPHPQLFDLIGLEEIKPTGLFNTTMVGGACLCMTARFWYTLGGFDCLSFKAYFEDDDLCIRASLLKDKAVSICYDAKAHHAGAQSMPRDNEEYNETFEHSKFNFNRKWPEIEWSSDGTYSLEGIVDCVDERIYNRGYGCSKKVTK